jgi:hypothetical protein
MGGRLSVHTLKGSMDKSRRDLSVHTLKGSMDKSLRDLSVLLGKLNAKIVASDPKRRCGRRGSSIT